MRREERENAMYDRKPTKQSEQKMARATTDVVTEFNDVLERLSCKFGLSFSHHVAPSRRLEIPVTYAAISPSGDEVRITFRSRYSSNASKQRKGGKDRKREELTPQTN